MPFEVFAMTINETRVRHSAALEELTAVGDLQQRRLMSGSRSVVAVRHTIMQHAVQPCEMPCPRALEGCSHQAAIAGAA